MSELLDLDAIEARADAATAGPWSVYDRGVGFMIALDDGVGDRVLPEGGRTDIGYRDDAEFIAHSRSDVPALIARVRELTPRVLDGDRETVRDQLDALPDGAQIRWRTGFRRHLELAIRRGLKWDVAGYVSPHTSESIAKDGQPIEVIG